MAKIAVLNDTPEVVVLLTKFLTRGHHTFFRRVGTSQFVLDSIVAFGPDVMVIPLYRVPEALGQPITDYRQQIMGSGMLEHVCQCPDLAEVPIVIFGFSTLPQEMPEDFRHQVRFNAFLTFPDGLQELNPTISSLVGPALGALSDVDKVRRGGGRPD